MSNAVIYGRISDDPTGRAAGVDRQRNECRELGAARGVNIIAELIDNDLSATTGKRRPGYERVLKLIRDEAVDTVIVWHTDRLYRLPRDLEPIIDLAEGRKLRFLTVTSSEIDLNNASGRMAARILAAVSAQEVEHKVERQRSASDQRAARGVPHANVGYALRRDGDRVIVDPDEAAVVHEAVRRILEGESLRHIAGDFNERGIPGPGRGKLAGKPWNTSTLKQLVLRPSLAGHRVHRGKVIGRQEGDVVLDQNTHDRLVALLTDPARKTAPNSRAVKHLLSGLAVCGRCGGTMRRLAGWTPKPDSKSQKATQPAYACVDCMRVRRQQHMLDAYIEAVTVRHLEQSNADLFTQGDPIAIREARDAVAAIDAKLALVADQYADDTVTAEQFTRLTARLRESRARHEATIAAAMPSAIPSGITGPGAREVWDDRLDLEGRRMVIDALMTVTVLPGGVGQRGFDPNLIRIDLKGA